MAGSAAASGSKSSGGQRTLADLVSVPFKPLGIFLKWLVAAVLILGIVGAIIVTGVLIYKYQQQGSAGVAVAHVQVATQTPRSYVGNVLARISPSLGDLWEGKQYSDSFVAEVETNQQNQNLGVKVTNFESSAEFIRENTDILLTGSILASSLADETRIVASCTLEGYKNSQRVPAQLFGSTASRDTGMVFKNQEAEFQVRCLFPKGLPAEKARNAKIAKLIVDYEFTTKATQRLWFLDKQTLFSLEGKDAFDYFGIDGQVDSRGRSRSKSTPGPLNFAINIDLPQPLTDNTQYILTTQLSPNSGWLGNLQILESLKLQVPAARDLEILMAGDSRFGTADSRCAFEYTGMTDDQFKTYELKPEYLAEVNQNCNEDNLRSLALSQKECIEWYKESPSFSCLFKAVRVPQGALQFDSIKGEATYIHEIEKQAVVEIRRTPEIVA